MPSTMQEVQDLVRERLVEPTPLFWSADEIHKILVAGCKDLWRDIADLKQEHFLRVNQTDVYLRSGDSQLSGLPGDVHKVYLIEPRDPSNESTVGFSSVTFTPRDWNHDDFRAARTSGTSYPPYGEFFYATFGAGGPVDSLVVKVAPSSSSDVPLTFAYVPTLGPLYKESLVPIPGEADNALVAWGVAYARAKEVDSRAPDAEWLSIYGTEKQHLLQSLGLRQYQEPTITDGTFQALW